MCRIVAAMILCSLRGRNIAHVSNLSTNSSSNSRNVVLAQPFAVSVVSSSCRCPRNLLRIVDLRRRRSNSADGRPNSGDSRRADSSVCVSPIFGRFDAVADLVEFVEVSRVFGAEKFQLYNSSIGRRVDRCVREYVSRGVVDVQPWNLPTDIARSVHYHGQILAINDCLYRLMYRTGHLLVHDLDEFVVPMRSENWRATLSDVAEKHARSTDSDRIASYSFRDRFFPTRPASQRVEPPVGRTDPESTQNAVGYASTQPAVLRPRPVESNGSPGTRRGLARPYDARLEPDTTRRRKRRHRSRTAVPLQTRHRRRRSPHGAGVSTDGVRVANSASTERRHCRHLPRAYSKEFFGVHNFKSSCMM